MLANHKHGSEDDRFGATVMQPWCACSRRTVNCVYIANLKLMFDTLGAKYSVILRNSDAGNRLGMLSIPTHIIIK